MQLIHPSAVLAAAISRQRQRSHVPLHQAGPSVDWSRRKVLLGDSLITTAAAACEERGEVRESDRHPRRIGRPRKLVLQTAG